MTTIGIGIDLVAISSFEEQLVLPGSVFVDSFSAAEQRLARQRSASTGKSAEYHLAARWAGKEAFVKAWSLALLGEAPLLQKLDMADIEIVADAYNRPYVRLRGAVAKAFNAHFPQAKILISLSHEGDMAVACVHIQQSETERL